MFLQKNKCWPENIEIQSRFIFMRKLFSQLISSDLKLSILRYLVLGIPKKLFHEIKYRLKIVTSSVDIM